jgi:hypothetical protein
MNLYDRDYSKILSSEEKELQSFVEKFEKISGFKNTNDDPRINNPDYNNRKFLFCYNSYSQIIIYIILNHQL